MNKQYVKGALKLKRSYLRLIDNKMIIAILVLLFNDWKEDSLYCSKNRGKRDLKMCFYDCHLTVHKPSNGHIHSPRR